MLVHNDEKKGMVICTNITLSFQSYPGPSLESEDFNIPPITPPSLPDHSLVQLNEVEPGYHSLCHPMNHNGLLPFHPQNMDLPEITVSNMLGQDGALLPNSISVVRVCFLICVGDPTLTRSKFMRGAFNHHNVAF